MQGENPILYWLYLRRAFLWVVGNTIFGLAPLIFMAFVFMTSEGKVGSDEMTHLIHDGVVLFVCCAVMGAVLVEFALAGFVMKGSAIIAIYAVPFFILALISIDYLFIHLRIIDGTCFDLSSKTSKFVMIFSSGYATFTKADLYIKEDMRHDSI
ncbi:MAG TPA: hypothetical protein VG890_02575 [Puia sp.]|nr:hypothetical protein [Puia sp.]